MKKYFCFYCQKDVEPFGIFKWKFCPHCRHRITDDGSGFYRVCENCGANMPTDAPRCLKCGRIFDAQAVQTELFEGIFKRRRWFDFIFGIGFIFLSLLAFIGIFYISFYVFFAALIIGVIAWIFNIFRPRL